MKLLYVNKDKRLFDMMCDNNNAIITNSYDDFATSATSGTSA